MGEVQDELAPLADGASDAPIVQHQLTPEVMTTVNAALETLEARGGSATLAEGVTLLEPSATVEGSIASLAVRDVEDGTNDAYHLQIGADGTVIEGFDTGQELSSSPRSIDTGTYSLQLYGGYADIEGAALTQALSHVEDELAPLAQNEPSEVTQP